MSRIENFNRMCLCIIHLKKRWIGSTTNEGEEKAACDDNWAYLRSSKFLSSTWGILGYWSPSLTILPVLGGYQKYPWASLGYYSGISVWSSQGIIVNDTLTENPSTCSHLCENQMWEPVFLKNKKNLRTG